MATMALMFVRNLTHPSGLVAFTAVGIASGILMMTMTTRRATKLNRATLCRMERQVANLTGEVSALRDESEDRWTTQRLWATDRAKARVLFGPPKE